MHCFRSVAAHLSEQGVFLIEAFVPDLTRFTGNQAVRLGMLESDTVQLDVSQHDPVSQQITSQNVFISEKGTHLYPVKLRYIWPSEFDLMAQLAGLELKQRWGSWVKDPFTSQSSKHISVYGKKA